MADTTISQLPILSPSANALIPFSQGGTTYATGLSALGLNNFFVKADCSNILTANMPNLNQENNPVFALNKLPINKLLTNNQFNSFFNSSNNTITVPYDGIFHISAKFSGYVPSAAWNLRALAIYFNDDTSGSSIEDFGFFNCTYSYSNTHFCFQPFTVAKLLKGTSIKVNYVMYSASGDFARALYEPLYNNSYLSVVQLS